MKRAPTPGSVQRRADGAHGAAAWTLADEVPVGILLNSAPLAVMMASPLDLEDLGVGFVLAEGYAAAGDITAALALPTEHGFSVDIAAHGAVAPERRRGIEGRSGCGLCGIEAMTDVVRSLPHRARPSVEPEAAARAVSSLVGHQPMRRENRSVHAAGFAMPDGAVTLVREDVGRHCALDKLVGALALRGTDPAEGFAVVTSRCSFELVQKAALAGLGGIVTFSAPTGLAVDLARRAGLPLLSRDGDGIVRF